MVALNSQVEEVLRQVQTWPPQTRIALARRVLETLEPEFPRAKAAARPAGQ